MEIPAWEADRGEGEEEEGKDASAAFGGRVYGDGEWWGRWAE